MSYHIATQTVHAGREDLTSLGVHATPIVLSSTYPTPDPNLAGESLDALVGGAEYAANPVYARLYNPTVARFEHPLATLEGAEEAVAFGSGMAALTAVLLALQEHGRHIVAVRPLYGGSDQLQATGLLGTSVSLYVDADDVADAIRAELI